MCHECVVNPYVCLLTENVDICESHWDISRGYYEHEAHKFLIIKTMKANLKLNRGHWRDNFKDYEDQTCQIIAWNDQIRLDIFRCAAFSLIHPEHWEFWNLRDHPRGGTELIE